MAVNLAISTEHLHDPDSDDVELGLGSSLNLLQDDSAAPVAERRPSVHSSAHSSVRTARKLLLRGIRRIWALLKAILSDMKLFLVVMLYSVLGAGLFMWIEIPNNLSSKQEALEYHLIARDTLLFRLRIIHAHDGEDRENRWKEAILDYENSVGLQEPGLDTDWTFWMSFLYAGTIFTTIGYGNIACKTVTGQLVTIFYAILGIPLMIIVLNDLGKKLLRFVKKLSDFIGDIILFLGLRLGLYKPDPSRPPRFHLAVVSQRAVNIGVFSAPMESSDYSSPEPAKNNDEDVEANPPVVAAVIFTVGWLFLCSAIFCIWEDWTYWTSFYFFFISLSTIGFGDVSPAHPEYMFMTFGVVLIGLALVSVCINVVQEKLNQLYMALLNKMLEDFQKAAEKGDQGAAVSGMMTTFQSQAKFLMPLMSKAQGAKVMTHFKEQAKAKGIELPPVLTNLDPETGMPAFAKAKVEEFQQYIEKANEQAKPPDFMSIEVQTEPEVVKPIEPPKPPTATVQSQTTDWMVNAGIEAKIYAESTESSTQVETAFVEMATQIDVADVTESSTQIELIQVEAGAQVFIDVRPESADAETETQLSCSDIDCQTAVEVTPPTEIITTTEQACQSLISALDFSQQTFPDVCDQSNQFQPDVQDNVMQTLIKEIRERQMQTVPEVVQLIPLQSAPPQPECFEIETQTELFSHVEASHQTEFECVDFAVQAYVADEAKETAEFGAQFEPVPLETFNFGVQASPDQSETQSQTSETPSTDSGIQTWVSMEDISTQAVAEFENCQSQTAFSCFTLQDNFSQHEEEVASVEIQSDFSIFNCTSSDTQTEAPPERVEMGIQPDLSSIYVPKDRVEHPLETEEDRSEPLWRFLRQTSMNTEHKWNLVESAIQTEREVISVELLTLDNESQTAADLKSNTCQTDIKEFGDSSNQTESNLINNGSQTPITVFSDREAQAQATMQSKEIQAKLEPLPESQIVEEPKPKENVQNQETETDFQNLQDAMAQTDLCATINEETSIEDLLGDSRDDYCQTENSSFHVNENKTQLLITSMESVTFLQDTAIQTLVSGFYDTEETTAIREEEQTFLHDSSVQTDSLPDLKVVSSDGFVQTDNPDMNEMETMATAEIQEASVQPDISIFDALILPAIVIPLHNMITQTDTSMFPAPEHQREEEEDSDIHFMQDVSTSPDGLVELTDAQNQSEGHLFLIETGSQALVEVANATAQHDPLELQSRSSQSRIVKHSSQSVQVSLIEYSEKAPVFYEDAQLQCSINLFQQLHESSQIGQSWFDRTDSEVQSAVLSSDSITQCSLLFDVEKAIQLPTSTQTDYSAVDAVVQSDPMPVEAEVIALDAFTQSQPTDNDHKSIQTEMEVADGECQAEVKMETGDHGAQVEFELPAPPEMCDTEAQTDIEEPEVELSVEVFNCFAQTEIVESVPVDVQTEEEEEEEDQAPWADFERIDEADFRMKLQALQVETAECASQTEIFTVHGATQVEVIMNDSETEMIVEEGEEMGVQSDLSSFDFQDAQTQSEQEPPPEVLQVATQSELWPPAFSVQDDSTQTHEFATSDMSTQLSTYFDRKTRRMQTFMNQKNAETQLAAEVEDAEAQSPTNWLQAFLEENAEERLNRMHDIGIQTGVLARVQHIFEAKEEDHPSTSYLEVRRSTLKAVSADPLTKGRRKTGEGSESSTSTHSLHEGEDEPEEVDPQLIARHGRFWERQQTVGDLRSRLEKAQADQEKEKEKQRPRED